MTERLEVTVQVEPLGWDPNPEGKRVAGGRYKRQTSELNYRKRITGALTQAAVQFGWEPERTRRVELEFHTTFKRTPDLYSMAHAVLASGDGVAWFQRFTSGVAYTHYARTPKPKVVIRAIP